jgi:hypothetical protein
LEMISRYQEPSSLTMAHSSPPTGPKRHVLHRQPRLSSLSGRWELAEKDATDAGAESLGDTSRQTGAATFEGSGIGAYSPTLHATPHRWDHVRLSTNMSRSLEWETETLFEQNTGNVHHNIVSYPCPYRKRNTARFNFRDYEACARGPFHSVLDLMYINSF